MQLFSYIACGSVICTITHMIVRVICAFEIGVYICIELSV